MEQVGKCIRENSPVSLFSSHESLVMFRGTFAHILHAWLALPAIIIAFYLLVLELHYFLFLAHWIGLMMFRDAKEYPCSFGR
jgi:hypothetical protein